MRSSRFAFPLQGSYGTFSPRMTKTSSKMASPPRVSPSQILCTLLPKRVPDLLMSLLCSETFGGSPLP